MREYVNLYLLKAENPEAYKKLAESGLMIGRKVSLAGKSHRPDIDTAYHTTLKFFNPEKDAPEQVDEIAKKLEYSTPDPKSIELEFSVFKDRLGNDVYVVKLHGKDADEMKKHHKKFSDLGYPATFEYQPHISIDKKTYDKMKESGAKNAHEAEMIFGPMEILQGDKTLYTYENEGQEKLAASEIPLAAVREAIALDVTLNSKHLKAYRLDGVFLSNYIQDNPDLKKSAEEIHRKRVEWHFGDDKKLSKIAWEQGIVQAYLHRTRTGK